MLDINGVDRCRKCGRVTFYGEYCFDCFDSNKHNFITNSQKNKDMKSIFEFEKDDFNE